MNENTTNEDSNLKDSLSNRLPPQLLGEVRSLINESRDRLGRSVNTELLLLHWHIGDCIRREILKEERAEYGKQIVEGLSQALTVEYGRGFGRRNLFNMVRFAEVFSHLDIVQTLSAQLSWSHFLEVIYLEDSLQRDFYVEICRVERWSVRTLRGKIKGMLYERTAISQKPEALVRQELATLREQDKMTPDLVFRDPYLLEFLGLADTYSEQDLEMAILREIERFLLELGTDFCFVARQKRMSIGQDDFYLDLLFFHRSLRCLVAIDLKLGRFTAEYKGQMELYLRWLDKYERKSDEASPIGLILCSEKNQEQIELLQLDRDRIRVAEYLTQLPPQAVLKSKLNQAIRIAHERLNSG